MNAVAVVQTSYTTQSGYKACNFFMHGHGTTYV